jgi:hypothetical protein
MIVRDSKEKIYWQMISEIGSFNDKWEESVSIKADIFIKLIRSLDASAETILLASFNPIALHLAKVYDVTVVCSTDLSDIFDMSNIKIVSDLTQQKYDIVLAVDEYLTYGDSETSQRDLLDKIAAITDGWLITTLQDYKNFAPHKKNQIDAIGVNGDHNYIMLENSLADRLDKQVWNHYWCCIRDHVEITTIGPTKRRTMYFKQLAKYSSDAGSKQYVIQKNLLYKGFFSRNFEHIITVNFG